MTSQVVPATVVERGQRLQAKAQQGRPTHRIARLRPSAAVTMKARRRLSEFPAGAEGIEEWATSTRDAAAGFARATRQSSTDEEHLSSLSFMLEWNELLQVHMCPCCRMREHEHGRGA